MKDFSEKLRESLKANRMSQSELARRINMTHEIVNKYCTGKARPSFEVLISICKELDESSDYLLGLSD